MNRMLILFSILVFGVGLLGWKSLPSHYCGVHCGVQWWISLQNMSDIEHAILEGSEGCRNNTAVVRELSFEDVCERIYLAEREILNEYYSPKM